MTQQKKKTEEQQELQPAEEKTPAEEQPKRWFDDEPLREWSIYERLLWVSANVGTLEKDSTVDMGRGGRFKAISHDQVTAAVVPLLGRARVYAKPIFTEVSEEQITVQKYNSNSNTTYETTSNKGSALVTVDFISIDKPEDHLEVGPMLSVGFDTGDKAMGKTYSYGVKYVILKALSIASGEDVDSGESMRQVNGSGSKPREPQRKSAGNGGSANIGVGEVALPTLTVEPPHDLGFNVPETAWRAIVDQWHDRGTITEGKLKRLFAIAGENGWKSDDVRDIIHYHLDVSPKSIAFGKAYDYAVALFQKFEPSRQTKPESTDEAESAANRGDTGGGHEEQQSFDPPSDDDIPF